LIYINEENARFPVLELNGGVMAAELATIKVKTTREGKQQRHQYCDNNT
jgi:hypothetical protein